MKLFAKTIAVAAFALSTTAQAGLITSSDTHNMSITDWTDTLTVNQFDATLGTLQSVNIIFSASMLTDMILDNDNITGTLANGQVSVNTIGNFLGLGSLSVVLSANTGFQALDADDSMDTDIPGDGGLDEYRSGTLSDGDMITATLVSGDAGFASFIGTGTLSTTDLGTLGGYSVLGGGGNVDVNVNTRAAATLTVEYTYADVPEPPSIALLALGLLGLSARRLKK